MIRPGRLSLNAVLSRLGYTTAPAEHGAKSILRDGVEVFDECGVEPLCFGTNQNGTPVHELYKSYDTELVPWRCP